MSKDKIQTAPDRKQLADDGWQVFLQGLETGSALFIRAGLRLMARSVDTGQNVT